MSDAIEERRVFIETLGDEAMKTSLKASLTEANSLSAFSKNIAKHGLQPQWHSFRLKTLAERITKWSKEAGIPWNNSWLTSSQSGQDVNAIYQEAGTETSRQWRQSMLTLIQSLDHADLSRISIPLDIVLKSITYRR